MCSNFVTFCLRPEATMYSVTGLEVLSTTRRLIQLHYTLFVCTWFLPPPPPSSQPPHIHASSSRAGTLRDQSARGLWPSPPIPTCCRRVQCVIACCCSGLLLATRFVVLSAEVHGMGISTCSTCLADSVVAVAGW